MRTLDLHTVCESARCPNMGECWEHRTATFMILGNICTRACGFCAVPSGKPLGPPDEDEPERVAEAVARMGLRYAVVTSVNRDDQPDGGAANFRADDLGNSRARAGLQSRGADSGFSRRLERRSDTVMAARPDVLNHNMETVPRLYRRVRKGAVYERSLELLRRAREMAPDTPTKTGMMLGLGETREEVLQAMEEIAAQGTHILTLGQYLQPTPSICRSSGTSIRMSSRNSSGSASRWDSSTWKPGRWCGRRITPSSRKKPRGYDGLDKLAQEVTLQGSVSYAYDDADRLDQRHRRRDERHAIRLRHREQPD